MTDRRFTILLLTALTIIATATADTLRMKKRAGEREYSFRVTLTDKKPTRFSTDRPQEFLSEKAIQRRLRQGIGIDSTDLPVAEEYVQTLTACGGKMTSLSKWNNTVVVRSADSTIAERLKAQPCVRDVKCVAVSPDSVKMPAGRDKLHAELVLHDSTSVGSHGAAQHQLEMIGVTKLHDEGFSGKGMTIAVLDAGFMNADLIPCFRNANIVGFADFISADNDNPMFADIDHGTMVLSTLAVNIPNRYVGAAPEADFWLMRCEDQQSEQEIEEDYWAAAAEYADSCGVDIISSSLGFHDYDMPGTSHLYRELDGESTLISHTASMLAGKGIVLCNSAGNDGMGRWKKITFPADAKDILTVGACTPEGKNATFSSVGPTADGRVKPDVMAQGSPTQVVSSRGTICSEMGTSFACPQVAGMVACLWQKHPEKTALEIIDMVRLSGNNHDFPDNVNGYGIPNATRHHEYK